MAHSLCYTPVTAVSTPAKPGVLIGNFPITKVINVNGVPKSGSSRFQSLEVKAKGGSYPSPSTKPGSIVCANCDGNGAIACTQCEGTGVNSKDHFNGQFKAGGLCWLCRGKREILCGNCNGAGFVGGFMSYGPGSTEAPEKNRFPYRKRRGHRKRLEAARNGQDTSPRRPEAVNMKWKRIGYG